MYYAINQKVHATMNVYNRAFTGNFLPRKEAV